MMVFWMVLPVLRKHAHSGWVAILTIEVRFEFGCKFKFDRF